MILALALFIVMYIFLLALPEKRPYIALIAAGIFILLGILPLGNIIGAVDWNIILMLAGTMMVVQLFIESQMPALMAEGLLKAVPKSAYTVLLDLYGKTMSSEQLAAMVSQLEVDGISDMAFIIGGAFGVSDELRQAVKYKLSFSPMTFTHQMVRLLLVEQIYRSAKINRNEPYHW